MKIHIGSNIIFGVSEQYYTLCNFLTIDLGENLQESFLVQNQFLVIKNEKKTKILYNKFSRWPIVAILNFLNPMGKGGKIK